MPEQIPYIRVFISSPGDVNEERQIAHEVIEQLPYRPAFRDRVAFRVIAWDKQGGGTPMRASLTPQEAINRGLPMPSESDIVVVLFWARMGTPFKHTDGVEYLSGTHFELMDALQAKHTETVIYRRMDDPPFKVSDRDFDTKHEQYRMVKGFFDSELFYKDGQIQRGVNMYQTPETFRKAFENDFEALVVEILKQIEKQPQAAKKELPESANVVTVKATEWHEGRSPFPGLRAFTEKDADIFFGRGRETDALVQMVAASRFVAVIGASGSGKSSLVGAGLMPRLKSNAITGSKDWFVARFTPGDKPFENLAEALISSIPALHADPIDFPQRLAKLTDSLQQTPDNLSKILQHALRNEADWSEIVLFVDQFEELLTLTPLEQRQPFAELLTAFALTALTPSPSPSGRGENQAQGRVRVVVTLRADFYDASLRYLEEPLRAGSFTLYRPSAVALHEMIVRPAERAGLRFDRDLPERIVNETGDEPGALALMAYLLDELYRTCKDKRHMTHADYEALGGVQKAIGTRAEYIFSRLLGESESKEQTLRRVFRDLVEVDERGTATRRRIAFNPDDVDADVREMIYAFASARLLTTGREGNTAIIEVAHEAILREWKRLAEWIDVVQDYLRLIRRMERDARLWDEKGRPEFMRPRAEELAELNAALAITGIVLKGEIIEAFTEPEQVRLLEDFKKLQDAPLREAQYKQMNIVDRLTEIGDKTIPVMLVCRRYAAGSSVSKALDNRLSSFQPTVLVEAMILAMDNPENEFTHSTNVYLDSLGSQELANWKQAVSTENRPDFERFFQALEERKRQEREKREQQAREREKEEQLKREREEFVRQKRMQQVQERKSLGYLANATLGNLYSSFKSYSGANNEEGRYSAKNIIRAIATHPNHDTSTTILILLLCADYRGTVPGIRDLVYEELGAFDIKTRLMALIGALATQYHEDAVAASRYFDYYMQKELESVEIDTITQELVERFRVQMVRRLPGGYPRLDKMPEFKDKQQESVPDVPIQLDLNVKNERLYELFREYAVYDTGWRWEQAQAIVKEIVGRGEMSIHTLFLCDNYRYAAPQIREFVREQLRTFDIEVRLHWLHKAVMSSDRILAVAAVLYFNSAIKSELETVDPADAIHLQSLIETFQETARNQKMWTKN